MSDADSEQFSLRWNNFHSNLASGFHSLLEGGDLVDVTLAAGGKFLQAHKIVLSVCSPYFRKLFKANPCKHPIVILRDVEPKELDALLRFMYQGEVNVRQDDLPNFLKTAEMLQIKGLTGDQTDDVKPSVGNQPLQSPSIPKQRIRRPPDQILPRKLAEKKPSTPTPESVPESPFKRMRVESVPQQVMQTSTPSTSAQSPVITKNSDMQEIEQYNLAKPKDEPIDLGSDIEEIESNFENFDDSMMSVIGDPNNQDSSQGQQMFALSNMVQDAGGSQEGVQGPFGQAEFLTTKRGNILLVYNRNLYYKVKQTGLKTSWICCDYQKTLCKARCVTEEGVVVETKNFHNHDFRDEAIEKKFIERELFSQLNLNSSSFRYEI